MVLACSAALVFAPLLRVTPEQYGLYLFLTGFFPITGAITAAVVTCGVQWHQTHRWASLPGLLLSLGAADLMVINLSTPGFGRMPDIDPARPAPVRKK